RASLGSYVQRRTFLARNRLASRCRGLMSMFVSSGTTTDGTSATRLRADCTHSLPQPTEMRPGGSQSQPIWTAGSNTVRSRQADGGIAILTRYLLKGSGTLPERCISVSRQASAMVDEQKSTAPPLR